MHDLLPPLTHFILFQSTSRLESKTKRGFHRTSKLCWENRFQAITNTLMGLLSFAPLYFHAVLVLMIARGPPSGLLLWLITAAMQGSLIPAALCS